MQIANRYRKLVSYLPTAKNYIQNGLIAMWDGIENIGFGRHDSNATVWKNIGSLGSTYDFTALERCSWKSNAMHLNEFTSRSICENAIPRQNIQTMELCFKVDSSYNITTNNGRIRIFTFGTRLLNNGWQLTRRMLAWDVNGGRRGWMFSTGNATPAGQSGTSAPAGIWGFSVVFPPTDNSYATGSTPIRIIRNGVQWTPSSYTDEGDATIPQGATSPIRQFIGNAYVSSQGIIGDVYCVRLYNRQLTRAEQLANYNIDKSRFNIL